MRDVKELKSFLYSISNLNLNGDILDNDITCEGYITLGYFEGYDANLINYADPYYDIKIKSIDKVLYLEYEGKIARTYRSLYRLTKRREIIFIRDILVNNYINSKLSLIKKRFDERETFFELKDNTFLVVISGKEPSELTSLQRLILQSSFISFK